MLNLVNKELNFLFNDCSETLVGTKISSGNFLINSLSGIIFFFSNSSYLFSIIFLFFKISNSALIFAIKNPFEI